jgi:transposase
VPTLHPSDLAILDNLSVHKVAGMRVAIEQAYASLVHPPPYSPDLNAIERVFVKLRRLLKSAAERTIPGLWLRIGQCLDLFTAQRCANYLRHAGCSYE